ncbi:TlpA family protein disulfide reductase [Sphingobacterium sp. SG20118]|uniref:TlpA family protein disulfide reductase n=1 Tax=Sphingobacterium sp. SG20118 TaxID=3367156 RepID=UPI0037DFC6E2
MKYLKLIALMCMMLITVFYTNAQSGKKVDLSKALQVGDTFVPPRSVQQMRGSGKPIDLQKFGDKVVILDFFDSFCGICIQTMPKLQKLQEKLKDKLQIITVGWQDKETLDKFFEQNEFLKENKVNLPVIYSDVYLKERFPHISVPHVAFLHKGKVKAIASSDMVIEDVILKLYKEEQIDFPLKDDYGKGNLLALDRSEIKVKGASSFSGYQNGVPYESFRRKLDSVTGLQKTSFYNVSIYSAVLFTHAKIKKGGYVPRPERLLLKVKDPNRYDDTANVGDLWYMQNAISYERLDAIERTDSAQAKVVLQDLHSFLGIRTYKAMKNIECLILKPCPIIPYAGKAPLNGLTFEGSSVLAVMTDMGRQFPPVSGLGQK